MKVLYFISCFCWLYWNLNFAQPLETQMTYSLIPPQTATNADIPTAENVLLVFKKPNNDADTISKAVMNYYVQKRGIPDINIVRDEQGRPGIKIDSIKVYGTDTVIIDQAEELIRNKDTVCLNSLYSTCDSSAWLYYKEFIETPIKNYLNTTVNQNGDTLKNVIRYIVLCKGIPHKIRAGHIQVIKNGRVWAHKNRVNVSVDALLCLINNTQDIISLFKNPPTGMPTDTVSGIFGNDPVGGNPYYGVDPTFTMEHRFVSNHYKTLKGWKLNYLVSRLDGKNLSEVQAMIDRSCAPDTSGTGAWVLDGGRSFMNQDVISTHEKLSALGFNTVYDTNASWITELPSNFVIGYTSAGIHAGMPQTYIQSILDFDYLNGAAFNTYESFNCWAIDKNYRNGQGLVSEFVEKRTDLQSGTGGAGHAFEPYVLGVIEDNIFFPSYAVGYGLVDAAYQGMKYLAWQNVIIGDPLTLIFKQLVREKKILTQDSTITSGDYFVELIVPAERTLTILQNSTVNFLYGSLLQLNGNLVIQDDATLNFKGFSELRFNASNVQIENKRLNFYGYSKLTAKNLSISGNNLAFHDHAQLKAKQLTITPGTHLILNDASSINIQTTLVANGTETNKIFINGNGSSSNINIEDASVLEFTNAIVDGLASFDVHGFSNSEAYLSVNRVEFRNVSGISFQGYLDPNKNLRLTDILLTGNIGTGISINSIRNVQIENVSIISTGNGIAGIEIWNCRIVNVSYCDISGFIDAISVQQLPEGYLRIENCDIHSPSSRELATGIKVFHVSDIFIVNNNIYDYDYGISLSQAANPYIAANQIQVLTNRGTAESGIFSNSGKGIYRLNLITGYKKGIELGNSFPLLGQNIITQNTETGLYVSANSFPDLSSGRVKMEAVFREFPLSGLNQIYDNGGLCSYDPYDGSEIYIEDASINLSNGCNTISDDRIQEPNLCNTRILLTALAKGHEDLRAEYNYWGYQPEYGGHNPSERIRSNVQVFFEPFHTAPCVKYPDDKFIVIKNSSGDVVIDTIFSLGEVTVSDSISEAYALASKHFYDGHFTEAKQVYYGIIQTHGLNRKSIEAYAKLYTISKLTDTLTSTFADLKSFYDNKLQSIQDTLMLKIVKHLSDLCLIAKKDYAQAINNFGEVIIQNPNSDEAFFAAIDILTTSLLDTGNTSLGKISGMDLSAKDASEYRTKLNALLKARNNKENIFASKIIPTEYLLYQNYPNPFNPTTKIQYDIPTDTKVELKIYDILGREVKTLVNEFQNAGRYNVVFNASNLASGVYIYQLSAKGFVKSRKMLIIK